MITGSGAGLGLATAQHLVAQGWTVYAGDLNPPPPSENIVPFKMDVTSQSSVDSAFNWVSSRVAKIDALIHFAGILRIGAFVDMDPRVLDQVFQVNVIGVHRVTHAFFPLLKRGSRVIIISSETAVQTNMPFNGVYGASKHAVDAYGDALRRELMLMGVHVTKIRPGPFKSDMTGNMIAMFEKAAQDSRYFGKFLELMIPRIKSEQEKARDPEVLTRAIGHVLDAANPPIAVNVKPDLGRTMLEYIPTSWADWILQKALTRMAGPNALPKL